MRKKRSTKAVREAEAKAALRARLADLAHGAHGGFTLTDFDDEEFSGMVHELCLDGFARWVGAIERVLLDEGTAYIVHLRNLGQFETLDSATEFLFNAGIRA